jgi:hypothetical protein
MEDFVDIALVGERFAKIGQLLEGVTDQDQGENLKLLAQRAGKGTGQDKDQTDHLKHQDDGEGGMNRIKMVIRYQAGQELR